MKLSQGERHQKAYPIERMNIYIDKLRFMKKILFSWLLRHRADVIGWSLFLIYEITMVGLITKQFGHPIAYLVHYGINIGIFYVHALWLYPWAIEKSWPSLWRIPLVVALQAVGYTLASYGVDVILIELKVVAVAGGFALDQRLMLTSAYRCIYFLGFATGYYYIVKTLRLAKIAAAKEKQVLLGRLASERELSKLQNAFLKAQINPHFLFNTLDFVYHMIDVHAAKASQAIVLLSRMMRYGVQSNSEEGYILLEQEIEQVENLLRIHQLRKENDRGILLDWDPEVAELRFIPMVLLTLVENMLKHGQLDCESLDQPWIKIYLEQEKLCIQTENLIAHAHPASGEGIGMDNVKKRLELAYGPLVTLEVNVDSKAHFKVALRVPLASLALRHGPEGSVEGNGRLRFPEDADLPGNAG